VYFRAGERLVGGTDEDGACFRTHEDDIERTQGAGKRRAGLSTDIPYRVSPTEGVALDDTVRAGVVFAVSRFSFGRSGYTYGTDSGRENVNAADVGEDRIARGTSKADSVSGVRDYASSRRGTAACKA